MVPCCMIDFVLLILYFLSFVKLHWGHMAKEPKYSPQDDPEMYRLNGW